MKTIFIYTPLPAKELYHRGQSTNSDRTAIHAVRARTRAHARRSKRSASDYHSMHGCDSSVPRTLATFTALYPIRSCISLAIAYCSIPTLEILDTIVV
ncbi:hypothetical protein J6590_034904 [Homalodisca vitripennis]|nr:hypothetical protein J6590_034904 [Homalodisca vitripennis]